MKLLFIFSFLVIQFSRSASSGSGLLQTSAQYVLWTFPSLNMAVILSSALDVLASIVIPDTGLSSLCGMPMKTWPGLLSRMAMKALYFSPMGSSPVLSPCTISPTFLFTISKWLSSYRILDSRSLYSLSDNSL